MVCKSPANAHQCARCAGRLGPRRWPGLSGAGAAGRRQDALLAAVTSSSMRHQQQWKEEGPARISTTTTQRLVQCPGGAQRRRLLSWRLRVPSALLAEQQHIRSDNPPRSSSRRAELVRGRVQGLSVHAEAVEARPQRVAVVGQHLRGGKQSPQKKCGSACTNRPKATQTHHPHPVNETQRSPPSGVTQSVRPPVCLPAS